jgi:hypothetical protein
MSLMTDSLSEELDADPTTNAFDEFGNYRHRVIVQSAAFFARQSTDTLDDVVDRCVYDAQFHLASDPVFYDAHEHESDVPPDPPDDDDNDDPITVASPPRVTSASDRDYAKLRPLFGWLSTDVIKETFARTTQYARLPSCTLLKRSFKSANVRVGYQPCMV